MKNINYVPTLNPVTLINHFNGLHTQLRSTLLKKLNTVLDIYKL